MRRMLTAVGAVCALAGAADAQFMVPGQPVGTSFNLSPGGTAVPRAAPQAGMPIGSPLSRPYDPTRPLDVFKGTNIDPRAVIAPVSGFPDLPTQQTNLLERLYTKIAQLTGFYKPTTAAPAPPPYTPGISRRNRERAKDRMWRRD